MKKAYIISTGGCDPFRTDFALISAYLKINGWSLCQDVACADIVIVHTCAFAKYMEDQGMLLIKTMQKEKNKQAKIIVTGCLPVINRPRLSVILKGAAVRADNLQELDMILNASISLNEVKYLNRTRLDRAPNKKEIPRYIYNGYLLRIGWGCDGKCSYCAVKFVFQKARSRPVEEILQEFDIAYK